MQSVNDTINTVNNDKEHNETIDFKPIQSKCHTQ